MRLYLKFSTLFNKTENAAFINHYKKLNKAFAIINNVLCVTVVYACLLFIHLNNTLYVQRIQKSELSKKQDVLLQNVNKITNCN